MASGSPVGKDQRLIPKDQAKRPYQKPAFKVERVFETQALSCGKTGTQSQCHLNRKTS